MAHTKTGKSLIIVGLTMNNAGPGLHQRDVSSSDCTSLEMSSFSGETPGSKCGDHTENKEVERKRYDADSETHNHRDLKLKDIPWIAWILILVVVATFSICIFIFFLSISALANSGPTNIVIETPIDITEIQNRIEHLKGGNAKMKLDLATTRKREEANRKIVKDLEKKAENLESLNKNLTEELAQKQYVIKTLTADIGHLRKDLTDRIESDCGGIINIPTTKESYLLQYKLNRTYAPNEKCLWTVENTHNSIRSQLTLKFEIISNGFKGNTGLFAFEWNRATNLTSEKIPIGKELELSAEGLYLSFTTDNEASTGGTGFLLRITVTHIELKTYGSNFFYRTSSGTHTVSNYKDEDQISIVISPENSYSLDVKRIITDKNRDILKVFEIKAQGNFSHRSSLSGSLKLPLSLLTSDPLLLIFSSDYSTNSEGKWLSILWNQSQD